MPKPKVNDACRQMIYELDQNAEPLIYVKECSLVLSASWGIRFRLQIIGKKVVQNKENRNKEAKKYTCICIWAAHK